MSDTTVMASTPSQEEVDLSDDQIQQLLLEAESRLRGTTTQITPVDISSIKYVALSTFLCPLNDVLML